MGLRRSKGNRGDHNNNNKIVKVQQMMDVFIGVKSRGVSHSILEEWSKELKEAKGVVENVDPWS